MEKNCLSFKGVKLFKPCILLFIKNGTYAMGGKISSKKI